MRDTPTGMPPRPMGGGDADAPPLDRPAFVLGVVNGAVFQSTVRLLDAGGLLGLLILRLTDSPQMIGVVVFLTSAGWFWPAIVVASILEHRPRKLPYYQWPAVVRIICLWSIAGLLFTSLPSESPWTCYWLIAAITFVQMTACGVSYVPFMDVVGKTVPPGHRGLFLALRMGIGEALGLATGAAAGYFLSVRSGLGYPRGFALMLVMAAALRTVALVAFMAVKEPIRPVQRRPLPFRMFILRGLRVFRRDPSLRNFTVLRVFYSLGFMAYPFAAAFARTDCGLSESVIAAFMIVNSAAVLIANLFWGRLGDRRGNRAVLRVYSAVAVLPMALALTATMVTGPSLRTALVGTVFFLAGFVGPGRTVGESNYILDLAPERRRSTYLSFNHTTMAPTMVIPLLAGSIADHLSYAALFAATVVFALAANLFSAVGLREPRGSAPHLSESMS